MMSRAVSVLPGKRLNPVRCRSCLSPPMRCLPGREPVGPRRLHQNPANMAVADVRDCTLPTPGSRVMLARNQAKEAHQLPRVVETGDVLEFGQHIDAGDHADTPRTDQRVQNRVQTFLEHHLLNRGLETLPLKPAEVCLWPPASSGIHPLVANKERPQALAGLQLDHIHVFAGTAQGTHRLLLFARNPHWAQIPRSTQTRQLHRITAVRLHTLPGGTRDPVRSHKHAVVTGLNDLPINPVPARTRLIAKLNTSPSGLSFLISRRNEVRLFAITPR